MYYYIQRWDGHHEHTVVVDKCEHCLAWISEEDMDSHKEWHYANG